MQEHKTKVNNLEKNLKRTMIFIDWGISLLAIYSILSLPSCIKQNKPVSYYHDNYKIQERMDSK
jgi:hypothetical protein